MFEAKPYQKTTIKKLAEFLEAARFDGPKAAFDGMKREVPEDWRKSYEPLENLADTPYVCLRLPTGGGKTFLAAQAVKVAAKQFLEREHNPLVLWLVPTDAIRRQTLETLYNPKHPKRERLDADFDGKASLLAEQVSALEQENTTLLRENRNLKLENENLKNQLEKTRPKGDELEEISTKILVTLANFIGSITDDELIQRLGLPKAKGDYYFDQLRKRKFVNTGSGQMGWGWFYFVTSEGRDYLAKAGLL